jgi:hypothetical protein
MKKPPKDWTTDTHPSFGVIQISRVSGSTTLFRSSLKHQQYIALRICRAEVLDTGGAHDPVHPGSELVEVTMSETQFARAITSMNMGAGSPVTISKVAGKRQGAPPMEDRKAYMSEVHDKHVADHEAMLTTLMDRLQAMRTAKKRPTLKELDSLLDHLRGGATNFHANGRWYREKFQEDVEGIIDEARTEIEVHAAATVARLGVDPTVLPVLAALAAPEPDPHPCGSCQGPCGGCEHQTPE